MPFAYRRARHQYLPAAAAISPGCHIIGRPGCRRTKPGPTRDGTDPEPTGISRLSDWIFDPDSLLIRAPRAARAGFARLHGLARVAEGVDYLTGPEPVDTSFLSAFAVREVSSLDLRHLRRMIQRHRVGTLEIKVRGIDIAPDALRTRLKPRGDVSATLLIIGGPGPARAVLARRAGSARKSMPSNRP